MNKVLLTSLLLFWSVALHAEALRLSEPVQQDDVSETFGEPVSEWPDAVALPQVLQDPQSFLNQSMAMRVEVDKVCQKKGCFFIAQQAGEMIRVSFKDYGFFVPTDIGGRQVSLLGELVEVQVSEAQAKHLSKDLNEKGRIKQGTQYQIVASSVRVPRMQP